MQTRSQIKRRLTTPEGIAQAEAILADARANNHTRSYAVNAVCEAFGFVNNQGKNRSSGCIAALVDMERNGLVKMPAPAAQTRPRTRKTPAPAPLVNFPDDVHDLSEVCVSLVGGDEDYLLHRQVLEHEHPLGANRLYGRQLRYLIHADGQLVGAIAFSSSARHMEDRDRWIGWDSQLRQAQLNRVVCMSRFLIRPTTSCRNLASKALSIVERRFAEDYANRYSIEPLLLESFVNLDTHDGATYRAANWTKVGKTKGRGRQDRGQKHELSIKAIYVRPLVDDFRKRLGVPENKGPDALAATDGLESDGWAEAELGEAKLPNRHLTKRLIQIATDQAEAPGASFSAMSGGNWSRTKACYRFFEQPIKPDMSMEAILESHRNRTIRRMQSEKVVLCIQDGSDLNYATLDACEGLGPIGTNQTGASALGLHLHSTLAVNTDGVPLGVLKADCNPSEPAPPKGPRPKEDRKSHVWIRHHRDLTNIGKEIPNTQLVNVLDREADFFDLFDEQRSLGRVDLLVRAKHNRKLKDEDTKLFNAIADAPVAAIATVSVPRRSARSKQSGSKGVSKRLARTATIEIRHRAVTIAPSSESTAQPVQITIIQAHEVNPPENADPLNWYLLTTLPVKDEADALRCVHWYCLRWRIEDWHRVLKSGCRIESLTLRHAERLRRAIAINMIIAWRIMALTLIGRSTPDLPADVLFSHIELKVLEAVSKKKG